MLPVAGSFSKTYFIDKPFASLKFVNVSKFSAISLYRIKGNLPNDSDEDPACGLCPAAWPTEPGDRDQLSVQTLLAPIVKVLVIESPG